MFRRPVFLAFLATCCCPVWADEGFPSDRPTAEQLQFFENSIRPLLAQHCFRCHSARATKLKAGLKLDSRDRMLRGGDSGAAIVPGKPDESLLMEAVRYESYEMPPAGKLRAKEITALEAWISMGAPWPNEPEPESGNLPTEFDWKQRVKEHWCWTPVEPLRPPSVKDSRWPRNGIDHFVLAKLEAAGIRPAHDADRRAWMRRIYFDLIGLPPTPAQVHEFLTDESPQAHETVVDALLRSSHFGEKWARHWMDVVRYGETLGHEFDYPLHHAFRYRDYLIRAFNQDVRYDQLVHEHIAGDLIDPPRRHPVEQYNESIIGTGFWFLGEACHAPTDVKADESDRIDNQIDVFSKTFLGLTVACARCHDHKFDPIPTADYYALAGYIQSSRRQEALLDPHGAIHEARLALEEMDRRRQEYWNVAIPSMNVNLDAVKRGLRALVASEDKNTVALLSKPTHPFYALAHLHRSNHFPNDRMKLLGDLHKQQQKAQQATDATERFVSFDHDLSDWYVTGEAFDRRPTGMRSLQSIRPDRPFARPGAVHSGRYAAKLQGVVRSPTFVLNHKRVHYKINGRGVRIRLIVDGYTMDEFNSLLFRGLQHQVDTKGSTQWLTQSHDVYHYVGHRAHIEIIDQGDGFAALEEIRFSDEGQPKDPPHAMNFRALTSEANTPDDLINQYALQIQESWRRWQRQEATADDTEIVNWLVASNGVDVPRDIQEINAEIEQQNDTVPNPVPVVALADGDGENEYIFIRGSHKNLGEEAPRRLLIALAGEDQPPPATGSGRLALAKRVTDPDNPLAARVIVNRLWHHLFGRGIVASVDDFGKMGQLPSHPALLDWLAHDLIHRQGWSLKSAIRQMVLSRTYRMSCSALGDLEQLRIVDPHNLLLHNMNVRRLPAEAIRDSLLMLSGRLDTTMYGPSVPLHLTSFMEGRGRPRRNGPRDGNGRRSLYIEVRRNFLSPMMLAFDRPSPFSSMGRRSNSNVPAQSLILMNDPFVVAQTKRWAKRLIDQESTRQARLFQAFEMAFARPPTELQMQRCNAFLDRYADEQQAWSDLCHMLVNMKSFIFLN